MTSKYYPNASNGKLYINDSSKDSSRQGGNQAGVFDFRGNQIIIHDEELSVDDMKAVLSNSIDSMNVERTNFAAADSNFITSFWLDPDYPREEYIRRAQAKFKDSKFQVFKVVSAVLLGMFAVRFGFEWLFTKIGLGFSEIYMNGLIFFSGGLFVGILVFTILNASGAAHLREGYLTQQIVAKELTKNKQKFISSLKLSEDGGDLDFLVFHGDSITPVEVKWIASHDSSLTASGLSSYVNMADKVVDFLSSEGFNVVVNEPVAIIEDNYALVNDVSDSRHYAGWKVFHSVADFCDTLDVPSGSTEEQVQCILGNATVIHRDNHWLWGKWLGI